LGFAFWSTQRAKSRNRDHPLCRISVCSSLAIGTTNTTTTITTPEYEKKLTDGWKTFHRVVFFFWKAVIFPKINQPNKQTACFLPIKGLSLVRLVVRLLFWTSGVPQGVCTEPRAPAVETHTCAADYDDFACG
jgi:hypothetical protein